MTFCLSRGVKSTCCWGGRFLPGPCLPGRPEVLQLEHPLVPSGTYMVVVMT